VGRAQNFFNDNKMRFCPKCDYFLFLNDAGAAGAAAAAGGKKKSTEKKEISQVEMLCKNCGFREALLPKSAEEALILETNFRSGSSSGGAASGITVNEYTLQDPTLPHVHTIRCPSAECESNAAEGAVARDVIYIKTDPTQLKFQYVCTVCKTQWTN
jgi:hypothetical protein